MLPNPLGRLPSILIARFWKVYVADKRHLAFVQSAFLLAFSSTRVDIWSDGSYCFLFKCHLSPSMTLSDRGRRFSLGKGIWHMMNGSIPTLHVIFIMGSPSNDQKIQRKQYLHRGLSQNHISFIEALL